MATYPATHSSIDIESQQEFSIAHIKVEDFSEEKDNESDEEVNPPMSTHSLEYEHILYRRKWHAFKESKDFYKNSSRVAQKMLFPSSSAVNDSVPSGCDDELSFIIDSSKLEFPEDITCDETGKYRKPSRASCELIVNNKYDILTLKAGAHSSGDRYTLVRKYFTHRDTPGFYRTIFELQRDGIRACPNVLIRYEWRTAKTPLKLTPHGNCKRDQTPYIRSKKQLLGSLRQSSRGKTAQAKMNEILNNEDCTTGNVSVSSLVCNRNQVYRHRRHEKRGTNFTRSPQRLSMVQKGAMPVRVYDIPVEIDNASNEEVVPVSPMGTHNLEEQTEHIISHRKRSQEELPVEHKEKRMRVEDNPVEIDNMSDEGVQSPVSAHTCEEPNEDIVYRGKWHAFKVSGDFYKNSTRVAQKMLFPSSPVNDSVPCGCDDELSFIIDSSKLEFHEDITCDETGKYRRPSYGRCELIVNNKNDVKLKAGAHSGGDRYTLLRKYFGHRDTPGFYRTIFELQRDGIRVCPNVLIRYKWRTAKTSLKLTPHGNCKHDEVPHIRPSSKKQSQANLKQASKCETAQGKMNEIHDHDGGSPGSPSFTSVGHVGNQVYPQSQSDKNQTDFTRYQQELQTEHIGAPPMKVDDIAMETDTEFNEDVRSPTRTHSLEEQYEDVLYGGKWHAFRKRRNFYKNSTRVAQKMLFPSSPINDSVPCGCDDELSFIIDSSKLEFHEDITCDETGRYRKPSYARCELIVNNKNDILTLKMGAHSDGDSYTLLRKYYVHRDTPGFYRTIFELQRDGIRACPNVLIRYELRTAKTSLTLHGNCKHDQTPYIRSKKQSQSNLKQASKCETAQVEMNEIHDHDDGRTGSPSFTSVGHVGNQVYPQSQSDKNQTDFTRYQQELQTERMGAPPMKVDDIAMETDTEFNEDVRSPTRTHSLEEQNEDVLYGGKWHAFRKRRNFYKNSKRVAQKMLFPSSPINDSVPCGCDDELSFIIDSSKLEFHEDITCDETGRYRKPSYARCKLIVNNKNDVKLKAGAHSGGDSYTLLRKYYVHRDTPGFYRTIFELQRDGIRACSNVLIRYELRTAKTSLTPHGNCKHDQTPYIRSKKQSQSNLKQASKCETAQVEMNEIHDHDDGRTGSPSFTSVGHVGNQVYPQSQSDKNQTDFTRYQQELQTEHMGAPPMKVDDIAMETDTEFNEDVRSPTRTHNLEEQNEDVLYGGKWHAFRKRRNFYKNSTRVAQKMLFPSSPINDSVPCGCDDELSFIIDSSKLEFHEDITCDETGKYRKPSYGSCELIVNNKYDILKLKAGAHSGGDRYTLLRKYFAHRDTPGFYRTIFELQRDGIRACPNVLIRYEWRTAKTPLKLTPHGNSKHDQTPYIRSKKQLLASLKQSHKGKTAQVKINEIFDHAGGSTGTGSISSVVRNKHQVYRHCLREYNGTDFTRLLEMNVSGEFVRSIDFTYDDGKGPNPRCVLYTDKQIADIRKHCIDGGAIAFDSTFDCENIFVTIVSYRHRGFVSKSDEENVLMPGPILLHSKKDKATYRYFGNQIAKAVGNTRMTVFGTDGEKAMYKGLQEAYIFILSKHLSDMLRHRKNVENELRKLGVRKHAGEIIRSIYGERVKENQFQDLVGSCSEKEYEEGLQFWCTKWDSLEEEETGKEPLFSAWFRQHKSQEVRELMLNRLRQKAGVVNPPHELTTNDGVSFEEKSWDELADSLEAYVISKYKELDLALMGLGEVKVCPGLQETPVEWDEMTWAERMTVLESANLDVEEENIAALSTEPEESDTEGLNILDSEILP